MRTASETAIAVTYTPIGSLGEAVIVVTTAGGKTFNVMRDHLTGQPRPKFVNELVKMHFGTQESGEPHEWTTKE